MYSLHIPTESLLSFKEGKNPSPGEGSCLKRRKGGGEEKEWFTWKGRAGPVKGIDIPAETVAGGLEAAGGAGEQRAVGGDRVSSGETVVIDLAVVLERDGIERQVGVEGGVDGVAVSHHGHFRVRE